MIPKLVNAGDQVVGPVQMAEQVEHRLEQAADQATGEHDQRDVVAAAHRGPDRPGQRDDNRQRARDQEEGDLRGQADAEITGRRQDVGRPSLTLHQGDQLRLNVGLIDSASPYDSGPHAR